MKCADHGAQCSIIVRAETWNRHEEESPFISQLVLRVAEFGWGISVVRSNFEECNFGQFGPTVGYTDEG